MLTSAPGFPGFPVRLASELFSRARAALASDAPVTLFDPLCGSGQLLTTIGLLHGPLLSCIIGSDVDSAAIEIARRNLDLLSVEGVDRRIAVLQERFQRWGKPSHEEAIQAATRLRAQAGHVPCVRTAVADALVPDQIARALQGVKPNIVFSDLPYDHQTSWAGDHPDPLDQLMTGLADTVSPGCVVVLVAQGRKVPGLRGRSFTSLRVGKRAVGFYRL